jgi:hypothetical protein
MTCRSCIQRVFASCTPSALEAFLSAGCSPLDNASRTNDAADAQGLPRAVSSGAAGRWQSLTVGLCCRCCVKLALRPRRENCSSKRPVSCSLQLDSVWFGEFAGTWCSTATMDPQAEVPWHQQVLTMSTGNPLHLGAEKTVICSLHQ